jgi:hypothetical protein
VIAEACRAKVFSGFAMPTGAKDKDFEARQANPTACFLKSYSI